MDKANPPALDQLTSLRFLAAVYVLVFHSGTDFLERAGAPEIILIFLKNGYLGVSFFFLLSGFILSYVYSRKLRSANDRGKYVAARFARLYPIYLLALLIALPLEWAPVSDPAAGLATLLMVQSWTPTETPLGYFWNMPGWTLSVELFFYIFFLAALPAIDRLSRRALWIGSLVLAVGIGFCALPSAHPGDSGSVAIAALQWVPLPLLRLPEFLLGAFLGQLLLRDSFNMLRSDWWSILAVLCAVVVLASSSSIFVSGAAAIGFAFVIVAFAANDGAVRRVFSARGFVFLGGASYALYLLQTPVRAWIGRVFTHDIEWVGRIAYQPILLVVSVLAFLLVERPLRDALRPSPKQGQVKPAQLEIDGCARKSRS